MKKAILHIGTEKTGTSTIQQFLSLNTNILAEKDLKIPACLGKTNHQWLPNLFQEDSFDESFFQRLGISSSVDIARATQAKMKELSSKISRSQHNRWLFSSEQLQSTLNEKSIQALYRFLVDHFKHLEVILYIRDPLDVAISRWSTQLKCGTLRIDLPKPSHPKIRMICGYRKSISVWSNYFGRHNIHVRLFDKNAFYNKNLIDDFCYIAGIDATGCITPDRENESLGISGMHMLINIIPNIPNIRNRLNYTIFKEIVRFVQRVEKKNKIQYKPTRSEAMAFASYFRKSNNWVHSHYFLDEPILWPSSVNREYLENTNVLHKLSDLELKMCSDICQLANEYLNTLSKQVDSSVNKSLSDPHFADLLQYLVRG